MIIAPALKPWLALAAAGLLFGLLFAGWAVHFWFQLALSILVLCAFAVYFEPELARRVRQPVAPRLVRDVVVGLASAVVLYGVFYLANRCIVKLFPSGPTEVGHVYGWKTGTNATVIGILLATVIGPGEELFWRGYLQEQFERRFGLAGIGLGVLAYGGVHIVSCNLMLIGAAFVCGLFWAALYRQFGSVRLNAISHAAWGLGVFVVFPLAGPG